MESPFSCPGFGFSLPKKALAAVSTFLKCVSGVAGIAPCQGQCGVDKGFGTATGCTDGFWGVAVTRSVGLIPVLRYALVLWQGNKTQSGFDFFRKTALMLETNIIMMSCHPESHLFTFQAIAHNI